MVLPKIDFINPKIFNELTKLEKIMQKSDYDIVSKHSLRIKIRVIRKLLFELQNNFKEYD